MFLMTRSLHVFSWWCFLLQYFFTLQPPRDVTLVAAAPVAMYKIIRNDVLWKEPSQIPLEHALCLFLAPQFKYTRPILT
jgi:hypothetical protein